MSASPRRHNPPRFTWQDYQTWSDERWELIDGTAWAMAPAPSIKHQSVVLSFAGRLRQVLAGKPCKPFVAPTDVKLSDSDVVQPDILVVCNPAKITASHIEGAPDLVVEVLSPHTASKDLREKKALYERAGVAEYLVIDPLEYYAIVFRATAEGFDKGTVFGADQAVVLHSLSNLEIPLWEVFELPPPQP